MEPPPVVITDQDLRRIRGALRRANAAVLGEGLAELSRKLQRAVRVSSDRIRSDVVTLDSQVSLEDPDTGSLELYTLILPGDSEIGVDRLSVLAPLGWQLLGRREGDVVHFQMPEGESRRARIKHIEYQPEAAAEAPERDRGDLNSDIAHQKRAIRPRYPIELICTHLYEPFQLTFARHAQVILPEDENVEVESSHQGLVLRGETEAALGRSIEVLQDYYRNQVRIGSPQVRYHNGKTLEEPYMSVRVRCLPEYFAAVKADLEARRATILNSHCTAAFGVLRATASLARLIGYARRLAELTSGSADEMMWLSHYAPVESRPAEGGAV